MGYWPDPNHAASWSTTDHLLASLIDCVRELTWVTAAANSKHKVRRPEPIYRPGAKKGGSPTKKTSWSDFAKAVQAMEPGDG